MSWAVWTFGGASAMYACSGLLSYAAGEHGLAAGFWAVSGASAVLCAAVLGRGRRG